MKKMIFSVCLLLSVYTVVAQEAPEGLFIASKAPDFKAPWFSFSDDLPQYEGHVVQR